MFEKLKDWARRLEQEVSALALAYRDPRTPWYAKAFALLIVAYVVSPIDPIPDFIPLIGHLDELLLVPPLVALAIRMIPAEIMNECRERARAAPRTSRLARLGVALVLLTWLCFVGLVGFFFWRSRAV